VAKSNAKVKSTSRSRRFGAFTRRHTLGKARALGKLSRKAYDGVKVVSTEIADGFVEEGKK
jgi:hypothetical protein